MSLIELVTIDSLIWLIWSLLMGFVSTRIPPQFFQRSVVIPVGDRTIDRLEKLRIRKWKDVVPEAGAFFKGGISKKHLASQDVEGLISYRRETKRAEFAHYLFASILPVFFFFNPWYLMVAMCIYAVFANVPCILIQRFNRARIEILLKKR